MKSKAAVSAPEPELIPRPRVVWYGLVALCLTAIAFGLVAFYMEEHYGAIVTGMRAPGYGGASWGLYIVFVVYFVGVSFAGITVAALARLFRIEVLEPVTRLAELLTLTALIAGATCVIADLGRPPHGLLKLPRYANPSSPFFGTFTLVVSGYLFSSFVFFFLAGRRDAAAAAATPGPFQWLHRLWASGYKDVPSHQRRHVRSSFVLSLTILPLLVIAHSTLGFVFGIQGGRPGWFSALQAPAFVLLAGVSGTGMLILLALSFRWVYRLHDRIPDASIRWLGNFLWVLSLAYLYFLVVEEMTATYAAPVHDRNLAHELVTGRFAPLFWTTVAGLVTAFVLPFIGYLRGRAPMWTLAVAAIGANIAAVLKRFLIVVPSQTHGALTAVEPGSYMPTWVEIGVVTGLAGLVGMMLLVFGRIFPLVPGHGAHDLVARYRPRLQPSRALLVTATALAAVTLILAGLSDSFRLWSGDEIDPRVPFAPVVFASGVMLLFISVAVYEIWPERKTSSWGERKQEVIAQFHAVAEASHATPAAEREERITQRLARLAEVAEQAVRSGRSREALAALRELQRVAAAERKAAGTTRRAA